MATMKRPANTEASSFLEKEGQYHCLVNVVDEQPTKKDGSLLDGNRFTLSILAGTEQSQVKRTFDPLLFNPNESHRDGGEFANKVQWRMADACNLIPPNGAAEVEIDWQKAKSAQIVVFVSLGKPKDGKDGMLGIDGAHIYHVDDPEVAHVPKSEPHLKLIPAGYRRKAPAAAAPPKQTAAATKPAATNKPSPVTPPTTTATPAATFNPDDL